MPPLSGGNFARTLIIDAAGKLKAAKGPLHATEDTIVKFYAHVYQTRDDSSGAAFTAELGQKAIANLATSSGHSGETESAETELEWIVAASEPSLAGGTEGGPEQEGTFHEGPATGVGLVVSETVGKDPQTRVFWWVDTIYLAREGAAGA